MKTIIVTGTSSGIGNQICIQAAAMNFHVISVSRNIEPLKDLDGIESFKLDITDKDSVEEFVKNLKNRINHIGKKILTKCFQELNQYL